MVQSYQWRRLTVGAATEALIALAIEIGVGEAIVQGYD